MQSQSSKCHKLMVERHNADRRAVLNEVIKRDGVRCFAKTLVPNVACWSGLHGHEILPRSRGGNPLDAQGIIMLCSAHHAWTHDNPQKAKALGLLR